MEQKLNDHASSSSLFDRYSDVKKCNIFIRDIEFRELSMDDCNQFPLVTTVSMAPSCFYCFNIADHVLSHTDWYNLEILERLYCHVRKSTTMYFKARWLVHLFPTPTIFCAAMIGRVMKKRWDCHVLAKIRYDIVQLWARCWDVSSEFTADSTLGKLLWVKICLQKFDLTRFRIGLWFVITRHLELQFIGTFGSIIMHHKLCSPLFYFRNISAI